MAFTAVHYPTDKDQGQIPFWPENEELGVATDFFDQFVTFDTTDPSALGGGIDLPENPPSPSILLDSLSDGPASSSSNDRDTQSGKAQSETSATSDSLDIPLVLSPEEECLSQSKSVPPELTLPLAADPVLSGGSISDSELLRLEGIPPKPAKPNATAPPSTGSPSPRKHSRVLDSLYATWCKATHRSKPQKRQDRSTESSAAMPMTDIFKKEDNADFDFPINFDLDGFADIKLEEAPCPVDFNGLPLSPPHTGRIPPDQQSNNMSFVTGHLDDPFSDNVLAPPATINRAPKSRDPCLDSPILTPALNDDIFFQNGVSLLDDNGDLFHPPPPQPKQRSASSAEWPMEGILTNETPNSTWASSPPPGPAYIHDMPSPGWWDTPQHSNGHHHNGHSQNGNGVRRNASLNLSMHNQQAELPYEYNANADLSGLMIHMPQPRAPQAAVLSSNMSDSLTMPSPSSSYYPGPPMGHHRHPPSSHHHGQHRSERRPRPRAPSSGARHFSYAGPLTSPRKVSSSAACYTLREESASPTPLPRHRSSSSSSSSLAVRKRRSWSRRHNQQPGGEPRTPTTTRSSSCRSVGYEPGSGGGGGGSLSIEFCNYTPSDKKVLMNGVAPSGSSKTKARREREALENKRKMSEAYMQALRAAGGDVEKLRQLENGFIFASE
ncbi:hypothetical protein F5Y04DRAFT_288781 [Hypomontagnella monticulosa]|nr:hypothetical protein F5Y04DRAFT_288781 [Hypomontagnella monticulosa]